MSLAIGKIMCGMGVFFDWSLTERIVSGKLPEKYSTTDRIVELYAKFSFQEVCLSTTKTCEGKYEFKYIQYSKSFFKTESFMIKVYDVSGRHFIESINIKLKKDDIVKSKSETSISLRRDESFWKFNPLWPDIYANDLAFLHVQE